MNLVGVEMGERQQLMSQIAQAASRIWGRPFGSRTSVILPMTEYIGKKHGKGKKQFCYNRRA